jgi:hypothetical protein
VADAVKRLARAEAEQLLRAPGAVRSFVSSLLGGDRASGSWRDHLEAYEVDDVRGIADELFARRFGHAPPVEGRHFLLVYSPPPGSPDRHPRVVAYTHQRALDELYLAGGMCVDERAYRLFPKWLFDAVKAEGGLATIVMRASFGALGDAPACFGHVGEPRARQADLRAGFVDTGRPDLMVYWRRDLDEAEKRRLVTKVEAHGPF